MAIACTGKLGWVSPLQGPGLEIKSFNISDDRMTVILAGCFEGEVGARVTVTIPGATLVSYGIVEQANVFHRVMEGVLETEVTIVLSDVMVTGTGAEPPGGMLTPINPQPPAAPEPAPKPTPAAEPIRLDNKRLITLED
jgi:hypothetical protein